MWRLSSMARSRRGTLALVVLSLSLLAAGPARAASFGWLRVTSMAAGAKVQVDGRTVGHLPLKKAIRLRAGRHKLKVTKPGYMEVTETVVIRPGKRTNRSVMLLAYAGVLTVRSSPSGAEVRVGQEVLGETPLKDAELVVGEQTLVVSLAGHHPWEKKLEVLAGKTYQFRALLEVDPEADPAAVSETSDPMADPFAIVDLDAVELEPDGPDLSDPFAIVDLDEPSTTVVTSETSPAAAPLAAVATGSDPLPPVERGPRRPVWKRWWVWAVAGVLVTGGIAAGAAGAPPRQVLDCTPVSGVDGHLGLTSCGG